MKLTDKSISLRWRTAAVGVLVMWVMCRAVCIAGPIWLDGCCVEKVSNAIEPGSAMTGHHQDDHEHHNNSGGATNHHHSTESEPTGNSGHPAGEVQCCDSAAVLSSAGVAPVVSQEHVQWSVTWLMSRLLSDALIERTPVKVFESPPSDLQFLSLLLMGPGHQPHGPPSL